VTVLMMGQMSLDDWESKKMNYPDEDALCYALFEM